MGGWVIDIVAYVQGMLHIEMHNTSTGQVFERLVSAEELAQALAPFPPCKWGDDDEEEEIALLEEAKQRAENKEQARAGSPWAQYGPVSLDPVGEELRKLKEERRKGRR